jgi:hypothetical protein
MADNVAVGQNFLELPLLSHNIIHLLIYYRSLRCATALIRQHINTSSVSTLLITEPGCLQSKEDLLVSDISVKIKSLLIQSPVTLNLTDEPQGFVSIYMIKTTGM